MYSPLGAISPLDGRYHSSVTGLNTYFSEAALMQYRLYVEIEYLVALCRQRRIRELPTLTNNEKINLRSIYRKFDLACAEQIKEIESETNHDVKAIEYYIQEKSPKKVHCWIHFALTSEDVNNLSYTLMWKHAIEQIYLPEIATVIRMIKQMSHKHKAVSMLSMTHGQPATPTTFGKELAVFYARISKQVAQLKSHQYLGKLSGATGTWSAHRIATKKVDWIKFTSRFVKMLGLKPNLLTTQIEPHDSISESYHQVIRINSILKDLCQDLWLYISRGVLTQRRIKKEVGSSTMPHKVNPIQFENAEGNLGVSNALLSHLSQKLPISRMQRDLTDSTVLRNQGVAIGHSLLSLKSISKGLSRIDVDRKKMLFELNNHWEVIAEAVQTLLRRDGKSDGYEQLKELTRGEKIDERSMKNLIEKLDISDSDRRKLLSIRPKSYIGEAMKLTQMI